VPVTFDDLIANSSSETSFLHIFQEAFPLPNQPILEAHRTILAACYRNPGLAPTLKGNTPEALAQLWLRKYHDSFENRISKRISQSPKTVADPIVNTIIQSRLTGLKTEHLEQIKYAHRLAMSAENIQGLLLEEFLAEQLTDYGWYCCWGESVRHVDFCNIDGSLLQVKNRSNSENSSSSRVRINQPIEKWHRVDAKTGLYRWAYFNEKYDTNRFSEENFVGFVQSALVSNPAALALEDTNPWKIVSESLD
jgi:SinI restriction endonuclease